VREALALINQVLFEVLAEQDEEYDPGTRWAITWYEQFGMNDGPFDEADKLARARNVSVDAMSSDGMVLSGRGKVRFVWREELPEITTSWQPRSRDVTDWVIMQRLAHAVQTGQHDAAEIKARIDAVLPGRTEFARDLAYRAFNIAELKGWTREALVYNTLVQNWSDLEHIADEISLPNAERQAGFDL
jgi:putative DNA methylase